MAETKNLLLFRKWDLSDIEVKDPGLKTAISLRKQIYHTLMVVLH